MSKRKIKSMLNAKKALQLSIDIGDLTYKFMSDMFDLDSRSIPNLSDQIADIPGHVAFVVEAHSEADKELAKAQASFDFWIACKIGGFSHEEDRMSEAKQKNLVLQRNKKVYEKRYNEIIDLRKLVKVLDAYRKGLDAKLQLAQTLSANIREERESYRRDYNKSNKNKFGN